MTTSSLPPRKDRIAKEKKEKKAQTILTVKQTIQEKKPTLDTFVQTEKLKEASNSLFLKVKGLMKRNKKQKEEVTQAQIETSAATPLRVEEPEPVAPIAIEVVQETKEVQEKEVETAGDTSVIPFSAVPKQETITVEEAVKQEVVAVATEEEAPTTEPSTRQERKKGKFSFKFHHILMATFFAMFVCYWWILS